MARIVSKPPWTYINLTMTDLDSITGKSQHRGTLERWLKQHVGRQRVDWDYKSKTFALSFRQSRHAELFVLTWL